MPVSHRANQFKLNPVNFTDRTIEGVLYATGIDMTKPDPQPWLDFGPQVEGFRSGTLEPWRHRLAKR